MMKKLDVLRDWLPESQNNFHWQLGGNTNHNPADASSSDAKSWTKLKNQLFSVKPLPLCKPLGFVHFGREVAGDTFGLDLLKAADES